MGDLLFLPIFGFEGAVDDNERGLGLFFLHFEMELAFDHFAIYRRDFERVVFAKACGSVAAPCLSRLMSLSSSCRADLEKAAGQKYGFSAAAVSF